MDLGGGEEASFLASKCKIQQNEHKTKKKSQKYMVLVTFEVKHWETKTCKMRSTIDQSNIFI